MCTIASASSTGAQCSDAWNDESEMVYEHNAKTLPLKSISNPDSCEQPTSAQKLPDTLRCFRPPPHAMAFAPATRRARPALAVMTAGVGVKNGRCSFCRRCQDQASRETNSCTYRNSSAQLPEVPDVFHGFHDLQDNPT